MWSAFALRATARRLSLGEICSRKPGVGEATLTGFSAACYKPTDVEPVAVGRGCLAPHGLDRLFLDAHCRSTECAPGGARGPDAVGAGSDRRHSFIDDQRRRRLLAEAADQSADPRRRSQELRASPR